MQHTVAVIGNPNCGKTTLFNALTGARQHVGNWSGVTVERKEGRFSIGDLGIKLVDLPGTYSLDVTQNDTSLDERIARDYALSGEADVILNIIDASNIERHLYLTTQLIEMKVPLILVLNMADVAAKKGIKLDPKALENQLGCPVVVTSANQGRTLEDLRSCLAQFIKTDAKTRQEFSFLPQYPTAIETAIKQTQQQVIDLELADTGFDRNWLALRLLEQDAVLCVGLSEQAKKQLNVIVDEIKGLNVMLAKCRYDYASTLGKLASQSKGEASKSISDKIDAVVLNRFLGVPIFLAAIYLMFTIAVNIGGAFIDFFDIAFGAVLVDGVGSLLNNIGAPAWLVALIADGFGGGIQLVATFIPVIAFLYLCLAFLEDSGYMARAAFIMDRLMRGIGLPGKSFVPLIVGFGCNVPSVMASRTLETQKDRLLTIAMAPFMSCGARLSVYALFVAVFFTTNGANMVFALYILGIAMAVLTGFLFKSTLFKAHLTPFIMELPSYHRPRLKSICYKMWERTKAFSLRAGKSIVLVFVALKLISSLGVDGSFGNDNTERSVLSEISKAVTPVFAPIGLKEENWPATVGIVTGVFAKEAVVGTLDSLYSAMDTGTQTDASDLSVSEQLKEALLTIPANLKDVASNLLDPLGLHVTNVDSAEQAAQQQEVNYSTLTTMDVLFGSSLAAFSYLVFILLYTPCVAVMGAIYREAGVRWMLFVSIYATGLAYITASIVYQLGQLSVTPWFSSVWLLGCAVIMIAVVFGLRAYGKRAQQNSLEIPVVNIQ